MKERDLQNVIRMFMSGIGIVNWRNNTGTGWVGKVKRLSNGDILISNPRPLRAGLCKGSSDIIGITPVKITKEMIGKKICVFTAAEVKSPKGKATEEQICFIDKINSSGGIAFIARSESDAKKQIEKYLHGLSSSKQT